MAGGKLWTADEIQLLHELSCEYTPHQIGLKLGRTAKQVVSMQEKQGIQGFCRGNAKYITIGALADMLHIDSHTVAKWNTRYSDFPARRVKVVDCYKDFVVFDKVLGWLEHHQELFDGSKVEPYAFALDPQWLKDKRSKDYQKHLRRKSCRWTPQEDARLIFLVKCGKSAKEIAYELHRPASGIWHRKSLLGVTKKQMKKG